MSEVVLGITLIAIVLLLSALASGLVERAINGRKDAPQRAFSRLGPLARRFPRAPTVRFHLGLLLLWLGDVKDARVQLRRAAAEGPATPLGREAQRFLDRLAGSGTG